MKKICKICLKEISIDLFYRNKNNKDGLERFCKPCSKSRVKNYADNNKEKRKLYNKKYREKHGNQLNCQAREYNKKNKQWIKQKRQVFYKNNKELFKKRNRIARIKFKDSYREARKLYIRKRRREDYLFRISSIIRTRLKKVLKIKKWIKSSNFKIYLGCSPDEFRNHLEIQFQKGMTWENYGVFGWHIDHIIPLSSAKTKEELYRLCHYKNTQPLWAIDNLSKGNKIIKGRY